MEVQSIINSVFTSVTYCLSEPGFDGIWLVDCGDVEKLDPSVPVAGVLLTHTHFDHIYGLNSLLKRCPDVKIITNDYGKEALLKPRRNLSHYSADVPDFILDKPENVITTEEETDLKVFEYPLSVTPVPGHDPSCLIFIIDGKLFTGDAYIPGQKVVTGFPQCDKVLAQRSYEFIEGIRHSYELYPGHV